MRSPESKRLAPAPSLAISRFNIGSSNIERKDCNFLFRFHVFALVTLSENFVVVAYPIHRTGCVEPHSAT